MAIINHNRPKCQETLELSGNTLRCKLNIKPNHKWHYQKIETDNEVITIEWRKK